MPSSLLFSGCRKICVAGRNLSQPCRLNQVTNAFEAHPKRISYQSAEPFLGKSHLFLSAAHIMIFVKQFKIDGRGIKYKKKRGLDRAHVGT